MLKRACHAVVHELDSKLSFSLWTFSISMTSAHEDIATIPH